MSENESSGSAPIEDGAGREEISKERRQLLRAASASGLALLLGACTSSATDEESASAPPTEEEMDAAAEELWASFDEGTMAYTGGTKVEMVPSAKNDRGEHHRLILKGNWSKWQKARRLTNHCAYSTGLIAAALNRFEDQGDKITKDQFVAAAKAVKDIQQRRSARPTEVGIGC